MNIFSAIFGDPQAQQAALDKAFNQAAARLKAARATGNKQAELLALTEMKRVASQGSAAARRALAVVAAGDAVGSAADSVTGAVGRMLTSKPALIIGGLILAAAWLNSRR